MKQVKTDFELLKETWWLGWNDAEARITLNLGGIESWRKRRNLPLVVAVIAVFIHELSHLLGVKHLNRWEEFCIKASSLGGKFNG